MESVHPLIVHFPIALLLTGVVLDWLAWLLKRPSLHRIALWNLGLGTLGAGAAVWSGYQAAAIAKHTFEIHQVMELHRKLGIATLIAGGLVVLWRLWQRDQCSTAVRCLTLLILTGMAGTLVYGAHLGGRLVYEWGVGGRFGQPDAVPEKAHEPHHHTH